MPSHHCSTVWARSQSATKAAPVSLDLVEQAPPADGIDEPDMPGVGHQFPCVGVRVLLPDRLAAAGFVDPDCLGGGWVFGQDAGGVVSEAASCPGPGW